MSQLTITQQSDDSWTANDEKTAVLFGWIVQRDVVSPKDKIYQSVSRGQVSRSIFILEHFTLAHAIKFLEEDYCHQMEGE